MFAMLIMHRFSIIIEYETSPSAGALQWLTAQQTCGKKHPYLFSQGQVYITLPKSNCILLKFTYFIAQHSISFFSGHLVLCNGYKLKVVLIEKLNFFKDFMLMSEMLFVTILRKNT